MNSTQTIAEGRYLGLYERDGWEFTERPNAEGVVGILALTPGNELVLVEQFRRPVQAPVIEIPAGLVGDEEGHLGESLAGTARRELLEETGYEAQSMELLLSTPTSAGMTPEITHLFLARGLQKADVDAVAEAIARLSVFAAKNEAVLDSIDVNPLLVLPEGEGAVALDGLIATK